MKIPKYESVSTVLSYIDNFNNTMNGKDTFNIDSIKEALENYFKSSYSIIKIEKNRNY